MLCQYIDRICPFNTNKNKLANNKDASATGQEAWGSIRDRAVLKTHKMNGLVPTMPGAWHS